MPEIIATGLRGSAHNHCKWAHEGCNWDRKSVLPPCNHYRFPELNMIVDGHQGFDRKRSTMLCYQVTAAQPQLIAPVKLPTVALLSMNGAKLVDSVDTADPTDGAVPYRNVGLPLALRIQYEANEDSDFHRYARVDLIGTFDSVLSYAAALPAAETALRLNPAPDVEVTHRWARTPSQNL